MKLQAFTEQNRFADVEENMLYTRASDNRSENIMQTKLTRVFYCLSYGVGACAILFAAVSLATNMNVVDILLWIRKYFGLSFSIAFGLLLGAGVWSILQLHALSTLKATRAQHGHMQISAFDGDKIVKQRIFWHQVGMQTANGISTLALTFTLLGISLGIGSLSEQSLSPENVNNVISILTTQFSMAFMTTVIGLPTATGLRAYMGILYAKQDIQCSNMIDVPKEEFS